VADGLGGATALYVPVTSIKRTGGREEEVLRRVREIPSGSTASYAEVARRIGDTHLLGMELTMLALALSAAPDDERRGILLEALACFRQADDHLLTVAALKNLHGLSLHAERLDEGRRYLEEGIAIAEELGASLLLYFLRAELAIALLIEGRHADAAPLVRRNLLIARRIGAGVDVAMVIFAAACCAAWQGQHLVAARLHGAADADIRAGLADRTINWSGPERRLQEDEQSRLRQEMGDGEFGDAYRRGSDLSRLQAVELALGRPNPRLARPG